MSSYNSASCAIPNVEGWQKYEMTAFRDPSISVKKKPHQEFSGYDSPKVCSDAFRPLNEKSILRDAEQQAADILRVAREKAAAIEQDAYAKGFEQGEKDGFDYGQQKVTKVIDKIENILLEMTQAKHTLIKQGEKDLLDIVFSISRKVVHTQISIDCDAVREAVLDAMDHAADKSRLTVRINPGDHQYIEGIKPEFFKRFQQINQINITSDPSINRGGCLVETPYGNVDATVDTQLDQIREALESTYRLEMEH
jgi:flagellar assembly protein FliH